MTGTLRYDAADGVARLTIDNPSSRNAMTLEMWRAVPGLVARAADDADVRLLVLEGTGDRAFCAGADISRFAADRSRPEDVERYNGAVDAALRAIQELPKPTLAVVRGACYGGGMQIALSCDLRLAETGARFCMSGARLGLGYAFAAVGLMVDRIGRSATADLLFTARVVDGAEAHRLGIVQRACEPAGLAAEVDALASQIAGNAPLTLMAAKRALLELSRPAAERDAESIAALVAACFASDDYSEGQQAFGEKRIPRFRGR